MSFVLQLLKLFNDHLCNNTKHLEINKTNKQTNKQTFIQHLALQRLAYLAKDSVTQCIHKVIQNDFSKYIISE